jgi:uridine phosphorylase
MGAPSTSILMHELFKLLHYAEAKNVRFLRMGTCGGLGVKPGTLILTKSGYDGCLEPGIEFIALGQKVSESIIEHRRPYYSETLSSQC